MKRIGLSMSSGRKLSIVPLLILYVATLVTLIVPGVAQAQQASTSDAEPAVNCEWYGEISSAWRSYTYNDVYQNWQKNLREVSYSSMPDGDRYCAASWSANEEMDAEDLDPNVPCSGLFTWQNRGSGEGTGYFTVSISDNSGDPTFVVYSYPDTKVTVDGSLTYRDSRCNVSTSTSSQEYSPSVEFAACDPLNSYERIPSANMQALVGECELTFHEDTEQGGESWSRLFTYNLRRTVCDPAIDTDGDSLSDCMEYDLGTFTNDVDTDDDGLNDGEEVNSYGTDPKNPDTDGDETGDEQDPCPLDAQNGCVEPDPPVDTDGDGVSDAEDQCPEVAGPVSNNGCPTGASNVCNTEGADTKIFSPEYAARVVLFGSPDAHLYDFGPSFLACWDGTRAEFKKITYTAGIDGGIDDVALQQFGFTIGYEPESASLSVGSPASTATAIASARFNIEFDMLKVFDKLGVKDKLENKLQKKLSKKLEKTIKKYGYNSSEFNKEIIKWSNDVSHQIITSTEKLSNRLQNKIVPKSLANKLEDLALEKMEDLTREFRMDVGALASTNALHDRTADAIADYLTGKLFEKIDPTLTFPMWEPSFHYSLDSEGNITVTSAGGYINPLLTVSEN